jgi:hypothetical protein
VVYGRSAEQRIIEIKSSDPFALCPDLSSRDLRGAFFDGGDFDGACDPVCKVVSFGLNQGIDSTKEIVEGTFKIGI